MKKINIILVDDHRLVRDGIKSLLYGMNDIEIIGEADDGTDLFKKLPSLKPDLLIMDISLPGLSGIEITKLICQDYPEIKVLILSMYNSEEFIYNAIKAGARGYLPKNTSRNELLEAIYAIDSGEEFFSESVSKIMVKSYIKRATDDEKVPGKPDEILTSRELEILKLYVEGNINKEISDKLEISIRTVETHKNHIMRKLGLKSTVEMVKFAIRNKIVEL
ncbi:MAG: response regulator transcription factor [Bacteroidetes bacterium]|nr:response regulator transcription factor [Bacteroidota bacterium]